MLLNTVALLLGVELILLCSGLASKLLKLFYDNTHYSFYTDGRITNFHCTNESVCAGDTIECSCTANSGILEWNISYSEVKPLIWNPISNIHFNKATTEDKRYYGYNFTFNTTYTGLNTSILTFYLNQSESVLIECADSNDGNKKNTKVTDLG